ncbi:MULTISPECIES: RNase A-like domain-containing protein [Enterococcus]|uniref:RNase A-like domain-containing protein n=1 Tax=Enterococcus TaxID=1350 RepID=UPI001485A2CE|nr:MULTISPECIES: RNase A-like domain-containing protein [Enterococcus]MDB1678133.1 hypothetical protein [Enterococcus durans]
MKKRGSLFLSLLLLLSFVTSPLAVHSLDTATERQDTLPKESLVFSQPLSSETTPENRDVTSAITLFNNLSFSQYASALPGALTLGAGFLGTVAAPIVLPAILGASVAYGSLQLGSHLGVMTNDLIKTSNGLRESLASDQSLQQDLADFALSGMDSTTGTYDFSQKLQTRYAQDLTSHTLMREYLTGTGDYGAYEFDCNDNLNLARRYISYGLLWSERERAAIVGRDASVATQPYANDQFFVLESLRLVETSRGSNQTKVEVVGRSYVSGGASQSFVYEKEIALPMTTALEQLTTLDDLLDYVQKITTFTLGSIATPSKEVAIETAKTMASTYKIRTQQISEDLTNALAETNNGLGFDPSGMIATLYGETIVLDQSGQFIYATTQEVVPTYLWDAISFSYSAEAIPNDDSLTIDGKRGVLDEETGDIVDDNTKEVLVKGAMGATWTSLSMKLLMEKIQEIKASENNGEDEDENEWYTPIDLYYDEYIADGGKGHTVARHVGKTRAELEARLPEHGKRKYASTFDNIVQALIAINVGIFTANRDYLGGKIKLSLGDCSFDSKMNRVIYSSVQIIPFGWGLHKKAKNEYDYHSLIRRTKVIIQKKNTIIRKKRKYYIVTAYPDIQKSLQDGYSFVSTTNFSIG